MKIARLLLYFMPPMLSAALAPLEAAARWSLPESGRLIPFVMDAQRELNYHRPVGANEIDRPHFQRAHPRRSNEMEFLHLSVSMKEDFKKNSLGSDAVSDGHRDGSGLLPAGRLVGRAAPSACPAAPSGRDIGCGEDELSLTAK